MDTIAHVIHDAAESAAHAVPSLDGLDLLRLDVRPSKVTAPLSDGRKAELTIDPVLQSYAEDAITSVLREQGEQYDVSQGAMVVTEPNGAIRALVGGTDYGKSQFNRATASLRQPREKYGRRPSADFGS